jgi:hypothetical protein
MRLNFFGSPPPKINVDAVEYKGSWNATTNTPALANTDGPTKTGNMYAVSVAGTHNFGAGAIVFAAGDYVIYSGSVWEKIKSSVDVVSVFGRIGVVTAQSGDYTKSDVGLGNVDNTSDAAKNSASATLTNKTLTTPIINSPTGIVKADVGLGNVTNDAQLKAADKDTDGTLTANSDSKIASQKAVKTYADTKKMKDTGASVTANTPTTFNLDLAVANHFQLAVEDAAIIAFTNCPAGTFQFTVQLTATSAFTFANENTLPAGGSANAPSFASLTANGPVLLHFVTFDGGINWRYSVDTYAVLTHANSHRPSGNDAIISNSALGTSTTTAPTANAVKVYADAKVADAINDGTTTIAPSQNAVFDALALKIPTSYLDTDTTLAADSDSKLATQKAVKAYIDSAVLNNSAGALRGWKQVQDVTNSNIALTNTSFALVSSTFDIAVNAATNDILEVDLGVSIQGSGGGTQISFDVAIVDGSNVVIRYLSSGTSTPKTYGLGGGWNRATATQYDEVSASTKYKIVAGDLVSGQVKLRLYSVNQAGSTTITITRGTNWAANFGAKVFRAPA